MKKALLIILVIATIISVQFTAYAESPQKPAIISTVPDCYLYTEGAPATLWVEAHSPDGGRLEYIWYRTNVNDISTIKAVESDGTNEYVAPQEVGVYYYCVGVWNVHGTGQNAVSSDPEYSRLIKVTYEEPPEETIDLEIVSKPTKTTYIVGEKLDLSGLHVRVWTDYGFRDLYNGSGVSASPSDLNTPGDKVITLSYDEYDVIFTVNVLEPETTAKSPEETTEDTNGNTDETTAVNRETSVYEENSKSQTTLPESSDGNAGRTEISWWIIAVPAVIIVGLVAVVIVLATKNKKNKTN